MIFHTWGFVQQWLHLHPPHMPAGSTRLSTLSRCNLIRGTASTPFEATGNAKEDADKEGEAKAAAENGGGKTVRIRDSTHVAMRILYIVK